MALELIKTNANGISAAYHRAFIAYLDTLQLTVLSYVDAAHRDAEKEINKRVARKYAINKQLNALLQNPTSENEAERISLSTKYESIAENNYVDYSIGTKTYEFDYDKETPPKFPECYALLKALPEYEGAKDV